MLFSKNLSTQKRKPPRPKRTKEPSQLKVEPRTIKKLPKPEKLLTLREEPRPLLKNLLLRTKRMPVLPKTERFKLTETKTKSQRVERKQMPPKVTKLPRTTKKPIPTKKQIKINKVKNKDQPASPRVELLKKMPRIRDNQRVVRNQVLENPILQLR